MKSCTHKPDQCKDQSYVIWLTYRNFSCTLLFGAQSSLSYPYLSAKICSVLSSPCPWNHLLDQMAPNGHGFHRRVPTSIWLYRQDEIGKFAIQFPKGRAHMWALVQESFVPLCLYVSKRKFHGPERDKTPQTLSDRYGPNNPKWVLDSTKQRQLHKMC